MYHQFTHRQAHASHEQAALADSTQICFNLEQRFKTKTISGQMSILAPFQTVSHAGFSKLCCTGAAVVVSVITQTNFFVARALCSPGLVLCRPNADFVVSATRAALFFTCDFQV